jgi:D-3-phosphoglycerate dehydrogenase
MNKLKVTYIPYAASDPSWGEELLSAVRHHDVATYDPSKSLASQFAEADVVLDHGGHATREMIDAAPKVRLWQVHGTGVDALDVSYLKAKGIPVANTPGPTSSVSLAESALMMMLMLCRRYKECAVNFGKGVMYLPTSGTLQDKTLGLVGFGASARALARRARPCGMRILAIDILEFNKKTLDEHGVEFLGTPDDLDRVVSESDYVSLHLHLNSKTRHTIDARCLGLMKPSACVINVARGALVDEEALYEALSKGRIGGAGLDVFAGEPMDATLPVYQLPNVIALPHVAGCTHLTSKNRAIVCAENLDRVAEGLEPICRVD